MKLRILAACFALLASSVAANATNKCTITEFNSIAVANGYVAQIGLEPSVATQNIADISGSAVQTNTLNAATAAVLIVCDAQYSYLVGTNPTATANNTWMPANLPWVFGVTPNTSLKISVIHNP